MTNQRANYADEAEVPTESHWRRGVRTVRSALTRARREALLMFRSAILALIGAVGAAEAGAVFKAWFWMPVVRATVLLAGLGWGIYRYGLIYEEGLPAY
jgi:CHASE2 domain-containing sensor protein